MKSYSRSAGLAEQALNAVKVVAAFGQENTEISNYEKFLGPAKQKGREATEKQSMSKGVFYFAMTSFTAYVMAVGSIFVLTETVNINSGEVFDGGDVLICLNAVFMGVLWFLFLIPNIKTL
mmetsp:Transcript_3630/g.2689  ORF Transcript_3630/g.2689 Transcript_3630/m.2689 type:complete len:121 (+) Transcript_3630:280-642(+)|eukprot:CAMPEP_0202967444 /NCGR_PEP_ID=MMETSP1396-20130829/12281_1 /ASSEMBLY_ACC=CAM_ASM_000872 /TAXON_ID= /ORGANISM="Pseudokeronopsis sp., Strain Brazil" /LENGTH=120 /DNA_ID=CAMNT_0049692465 /DNA_START=577 /DNA_END=939 /DNA_ORIENTATION=+